MIQFYLESMPSPQNPPRCFIFSSKLGNSKRAILLNSSFGNIFDTGKNAGMKRNSFKSKTIFSATVLNFPYYVLKK